MNTWYSPDTFVIIKIDGQQHRKVGKRYGLKSYPAFYSLEPGVNGTLQSQFKLKPRKYETLKKWMLEMMGDTPMLAQVEIPETIDEKVGKI